MGSNLVQALRLEDGRVFFIDRGWLLDVSFLSPLGCMTVVLIFRVGGLFGQLVVEKLLFQQLLLRTVLRLGCGVGWRTLLP